MKLWQTNTFAATVLVLAIYGCSSDDDDTAGTSGTGGKAGHAGSSTTGGKTSTGGKSSTAGKAAGGKSSGGTGTGATSGEATTGGAGGESASGGVPGAGGASGGASGGEANLGGEGGAATVDVTGKWDITEVIATGPSAGTYTGVFTLAETGDAVTGTAAWTGGVVSTLTGYVHGARIHVDRVDVGSGFRATFDGRVNTAADAMSGSGANDASSPGGNDATYTWTGTLQ